MESQNFYEEPKLLAGSRAKMTAPQGSAKTFSGFP
jgi:hypothetical protein